MDNGFDTKIKSTQAVRRFPPRVAHNISHVGRTLGKS